MNNPIYNSLPPEFQTMIRVKYSAYSGTTDNVEKIDTFILSLIDNGIDLLLY